MKKKMEKFRKENQLFLNDENFMNVFLSGEVFD
jgi:hypothetical protein